MRSKTTNPQPTFVPISMHHSATTNCSEYFCTTIIIIVMHETINFLEKIKQQEYILITGKKRRLRRMHPAWAIHHAAQIYPSLLYPFQQWLGLHQKQFLHQYFRPKRQSFSIVKDNLPEANRQKATFINTRASGGREAMTFGQYKELFCSKLK